MDFLSNLAKNVQSKPESESEKPACHDGKQPSGSGDLFADAKLVAEAAQSHFSNEPEKYDKAKVSAAAADILDAASGYAKLDDTKGIGKYVDQAEGYLRQYNTSSVTDAPKHAPEPVKESGDGCAVTAPPADKAEKPGAAEAPSAHETEKPAGGAGDYIKMAEGLLNKPPAESGKEEGSSEPEGGYGDLMKKAGGFLKK